MLRPSRGTRHTAAGSPRAGRPKGPAPGTSAAGALDVATHGTTGVGALRDQFGLEITSILGETHKFASKQDYWGVFVNNVPVCRRRL